MSGRHNVTIVAGESVAQKWLIPRLVGFRTAHPDFVVTLDTAHADFWAGPLGFDLEIAYVDEAAWARWRSRGAETLFMDSLRPVCSPALLATQDTPREAANLAAWPLACRLGGDADWPYWFERRGVPVPDLAGAWGFGLYSMVVQAAIDGLGAVVGHSALIARELATGTLVPILDRSAGAALRCCLFTTVAARNKAKVGILTDWLLRQGERSDEQSSG